MNLNSNPTKQELRDLLQKCDDTAGNHVLWVAKSGAVKIARLAADQHDDAFQQRHPEMQMRCETFLAGNGYVGAKTAHDEEWITVLFDSLLEQWPLPD